MGLALRLAPFFMGLMRRWMPIARLGSTFVVTRHDDVVEAFATDRAFGVPYHDNLEIVTGGEPFFLGMSDGPDYRRQLATMRAVCRAEDLPRLGDEAEARARVLVDASGGEVELVGFVRTIAFDMIGGYFGIGEPADGSLSVWGSRLFEFQFTGSPADRAWRSEVEAFGNAMRGHIDATIAARKTQADRPDDILSRCLALQEQGAPGYSDREIRTALLCMIVGGPPQPPMVLPQAMEQLLRRPDWLAEARRSARADEDDRLRKVVSEAMRFDPIAPAFKRIALKPWTLARGMPWQRQVPAGATLIAAIASAMMDERRIPDPERFDPDRQPYEYIHFGHGLHTCFGLHINQATLHRMLKPLLAREGLRRAAGPSGRLRKAGPFADRLVVRFD
jgi:cytochrome P450